VFEGMLDRMVWALAGSSIFLGTFIGEAAMAQTKTPNADAAAVLRTWPKTGVWQTALIRRKDQTFACAMVSGHQENHTTEYLAGIRQRPRELSLVISDREQNSVTGKFIRLLIDNVEIGSFEVSTRVEDQAPFHIISAVVPEAQTQRIINLFRSGANVKFVTGSATFDFPLTGAAHGLIDMQQCASEVANLAPTQ
jgi:hypothetical protein